MVYSFTLKPHKASEIPDDIDSLLTDANTLLNDVPNWGKGSKFSYNFHTNEKKNLKESVMMYTKYMNDEYWIARISVHDPNETGVTFEDFVSGLLGAKLKHSKHSTTQENPNNNEDNINITSESTGNLNSEDESTMTSVKNNSIQTGQSLTSMTTSSDITTIDGNNKLITNPESEWILTNRLKHQIHEATYVDVLNVWKPIDLPNDEQIKEGWVGNTLEYELGYPFTTRVFNQFYYLAPPKFHHLNNTTNTNTNTTDIENDISEYSFVVSIVGDYFKPNPKHTRAEYSSIERIRKLNNGKIEWIVATCSEPHVTCPKWLQHKVTVRSLAANIPQYFKWVASHRDLIESE